MTNNTIKRHTPQDLANLITKQTIERLRADGLECDCNIDNAICTVKQGKKYIKIDQGTSEKYMIDTNGNIFGIKAYGIIHHVHYYGTLDTINNYYWGNYPARRII